MFTHVLVSVIVKNLHVLLIIINKKKSDKYQLQTIRSHYILHSIERYISILSIYLSYITDYIAINAHEIFLVKHLC